MAVDPEPDGTYSARTKHGMISVIIHEVGHNFYPMIINSDERQWTWMDEGLNTFVQYLAEKEFDRNYPTRRGPARDITNYMGGDPRAHLSHHDQLREHLPVWSQCLRQARHCAEHSCGNR